MAVRNFWVDAEVDDRKTEIGGGPRSKAGGMEVTIYQRDDGKIETAVRIVCKAYGDTLVTTVDFRGDRVGRFETRR